MSEPSETPCPKKPRRKTQFKPGQSGNPLGRPKRKLDMSVALNKALNDKILVTNLGKTKRGWRPSSSRLLTAYCKVTPGVFPSL
jgi:hypothetical protein